MAFTIGLQVSAAGNVVVVLAIGSGLAAMLSCQTVIPVVAVASCLPDSRAPVAVAMAGDSPEAAVAIALRIVALVQPSLRKHLAENQAKLREIALGKLTENCN